MSRYSTCYQKPKPVKTMEAPDVNEVQPGMFNCGTRKSVYPVTALVVACLFKSHRSAVPVGFLAGPTRDLLGVWETNDCEIKWAQAAEFTVTDQFDFEKWGFIRVQLWSFITQLKSMGIFKSPVTAFQSVHEESHSRRIICDALQGVRDSFAMRWTTKGRHG